VTREVLLERLAQVSDKAEIRYARLKALFEAAGCKGENLTEMPVPEKKLPNLICDLPGAEPRTVIVGAHHDMVDVGEGAADNWSGSAMLPSLYESLAKSPRKWSFRFIAFTAEETGLHGSRHYTREVKKKRQPVPIAMVNVDTVGLAPAQIWLSRANKRLANTFAIACKRLDHPVLGSNADGVAEDDSFPFHEAGIPTISIDSITQENFKILHSPRDKLSVVNPDHYEKTYRVVSFFLAVMDLLTVESLNSSN
jgi:Iap family predicted aminopeptidase